MSQAALVVACGYSTEPDVAAKTSETVNAASSFFSRQGFTVDVLADDGHQQLPTRANIVQALERLVSCGGHGKHLCLAMVGCGGDQPVCFLPSDYTAQPGLTTREMEHLLVGALPPGTSLTVVCDLLSGGTVLPLAHALSADRDPVTGNMLLRLESAPAPPTVQSTIHVLSTDRGLLLPSAAGGLLSAVIAALNLNPAPAKQQLLADVWHVMSLSSGADGPMPRLSSSRKLSAQDVLRLAPPSSPAALPSAAAAPPSSHRAAQPPPPSSLAQHSAVASRPASRPATAAHSEQPQSQPQPQSQLQSQAQQPQSQPSYTFNSVPAPASPSSIPGSPVGVSSGERVQTPASPPQSRPAYDPAAQSSAPQSLHSAEHARPSASALAPTPATSVPYARQSRAAPVTSPPRSSAQLTSTPRATPADDAVLARDDGLPPPVTAGGPMPTETVLVRDSYIPVVAEPASAAPASVASAVSVAAAPAAAAAASPAVPVPNRILAALQGLWLTSTETEVEVTGQQVRFPESGHCFNLEWNGVCVELTGSSLLGNPTGAPIRLVWDDGDVWAKQGCAIPMVSTSPPPSYGGGGAAGAFHSPPQGLPPVSTPPAQQQQQPVFHPQFIRRVKGHPALTLLVTQMLQNRARRELLRRGYDKWMLYMLCSRQYRRIRNIARSLETTHVILMLSRGFRKWRLWLVMRRPTSLAYKFRPVQPRPAAEPRKVAVWLRRAIQARLQGEPAEGVYAALRAVTSEDEWSAVQSEYEGNFGDSLPIALSTLLLPLEAAQCAAVLHSSNVSFVPVSAAA